MSTLTIDSVTKEYGEVTALDDVSFEIDDEFVVLLGESGAGKSTLLRCINGLTEPTDGDIRLDGDSITRSNAAVGMIFQQHNLVEGLSAFANALTGSLNEWSTVRTLLQQQDEATKTRALEALETVGLLEEAHQRVSQMSGGQQQRVGIARAHFGERFIGLRDGELMFDATPDELTPALIDDLYGNVETVALAEERTTKTTTEPEAVGATL